jgi:hypothetical protein
MDPVELKSCNLESHDLEQFLVNFSFQSNNGTPSHTKTWVANIFLLSYGPVGVSLSEPQITGIGCSYIYRTLVATFKKRN